MRKSNPNQKVTSTTHWTRSHPPSTIVVEAGLLNIYTSPRGLREWAWPGTKEERGRSLPGPLLLLRGRSWIATKEEQAQQIENDRLFTPRINREIELNFDQFSQISITLIRWRYHTTLPHFQLQCFPITHYHHPQFQQEIKDQLFR